MDILMNEFSPEHIESPSSDYSRLDELVNDFQFTESNCEQIHKKSRQNTHQNHFYNAEHATIPESKVVILYFCPDFKLEAEICKGEWS